MKEQINVLSPLTWRWVGVNYDEVDIAEDPPFPEVEIKVDSGHELQSINTKMIGDSEPLFAGMENGVGPLWLANHFAELSCGYYITGTTAGDEPIAIHFSTRTGLLSDHNLIHAKEGETIRVLMSYGGVTELHSGVTRIIAEKGAKVFLYKLHGEVSSRQSVDIITAKVAEGAHVEVLSVETGGAHSLTNVLMELGGDRAHGGIETVYFGQNQQVLDLHYRINHLGKNTTSNIVVNGILKDSAKKTFKGILDFVRGSAGSVGNEMESAVLLDETVTSRAVPILLCTEDDVLGNHAANAGRLDDDALFYLMSRGLAIEEAKKLLVLAKVAPTIEKIPVEKEREALLQFLENSLKQTEGAGR